jgi:cell division protein FtsQ
MIKKIALILISLLFLSYLIYAAITFIHTPQEQVCNTIHIFKVDSIDYNFVKRKDIEKQLEENNIHPEGKKIDYYFTHRIEEVIKTMNYVKRVECYRTNKGDVVIRIWQRQPVVRIITPFDSYYIDQDREKMPISKNFTVMLPIVSGNFTERYAKNELFDFVSYISNDAFWNAQIEQIYVKENKKIELVPKVGLYTITLGKLENYEDKLKKLYLFYKTYPQFTLIDTYSNINIEYNKLLYATKK